MLSRSFVLWSTRRRNGACRRWTLSLSLSLRVTSFVLEASAMLPLSKVAAVSLHLELWISKDRSHHFLTDTVKREGNGKTWRVNSALLGIKLLRLRSISNGGSPDFFPPSLFVTAFLYFYDDFPVNRNFFSFSFFFFLFTILKPFVSRCICFA